jgi:uncharacterized protein (DUF1800 family)
VKRNFVAACGLVANGMIAVFLAGCASGGSNSTGPTQPQPAVLAVSPATGTLRGGATQSFTVSGNGSPTVTWSVEGVASGNTTVGTISAAGLYTAPTFPPTPNSVTITATETADATKAANASFTLQNPLPQITSISPASIPVGAFTLAVTGSQFATGAVVQWNGVALSTTYVSSTELTATGTATSSQVGTVPVTVDNPDPGSILSAAVNAQVTAVSSQSTTATAAARFLDQSSFGPTATTIPHVQQIGLQAALTEQFNQPTTLFSEPPSPDTTVCGFTNWHCTQSEFVNVSTWGNDQLRQRVAMALSEIFVAPIEQDNAMPLYLNTLANDAFTNYRQIMQDVATSPDMGYYLNMLNSGKPAAGQIANENFGRENMQLFTLGLALLNPDGTLQTDSSGNPIPTYTELQVEAFARAYTGWTYANADGSTPTKFNSTKNWLYPMVAVESEHDTTAKILLNGTALVAGQSAEDDLKGALDNIFAHPNIGPFVCRQLIQHLVSGDPSPAYVSRVAAVFADNGIGVRGDMKAVLTAILLDPEARAGDAQTGDQADSSPAVDGGHLREPLLYTINLLRGLNAAPPDPTVPYPYVSFMSQALSAVGEAPFNQASVFNYFPPEYVIPQTSVNAPEFALENTGSVVPRLSLTDHIIHNKASGPTVDLSATSAIGQQATDAGQLVDYLGMIFMHSQMSTSMRTAIVQAISAIPSTDLQGRAQVAVFLVVTSSQYKIMH